MPADQQAAYAFTLEVTGQVPGPHKIWLVSPRLNEAIVPLGAACSGEGRAAPRSPS